MALRLVPVPETFTPDPALWNLIVDSWDADEFETLTSGLNAVPVPGRLADGSLALVFIGKAAVVEAR